MKTVIGLFDTHAHAERAAHALERAGISHNDISLIANNASGQFGEMDDAPADAPHVTDADSETRKGAVAGGVAGLLVSLAALAIPGLGAVAAAGWLLTTLTGALVGAGVGLVGALHGAGISHEEAAIYHEGVRRGGTLLAARVSDDRADEIAQVLRSEGAVDINERAEQYRQEGFVAPAASADLQPAAVAAVPAVSSTRTSPTPKTPDQPAAPASRRAPARAQSTAATPPAVAMEQNAAPAGRSGSPVAVEERPGAGMRETALGGERVSSHVTGRPVQENIARRAEPVKTEYPEVGRAANGADSAPAASDLHSRIEVRAYELYEQRGRADGLALQDWLNAEQEILNSLV